MINYTPQINIDKILKYSSQRVVAGEDGFIKINKFILEGMTGNDDFLASVEDVDEFENGDIIACTSDGDFGLYLCDKKNKTYILEKLNIKIKDDCIYNIKTLTENKNSNTRSFECWGERGVKHTFEI